MIYAGLFFLSAAFAAPTFNQTVVLNPDGRPVFIEVPPNLVVNVTVEQRRPDVISGGNPQNPDTQTSKWTQSPVTTILSSTSAFTTMPSSSTTTPGSSTMNVNMTFTPAQATPVSSSDRLIGYFVSATLPLGSEGPNANRQAPMNAVLAAGDILDAVASQPVISDPSRRPIITRTRRLEMRFLDFQMNRTNAANPEINNNITISVKFIAGSAPQLAANEDIAPVNMANVTPPLSNNTGGIVHHNITIVPESLTGHGFQQLFNGSYVTSNENKVTVERIVTVEMCGEFSNFQRGYLEVLIRPTTDADAASGFPQGYYKCYVDLNYSPAFQESEAYWSSIMQCNSGNSNNNLSYRLWLRTRQYLIDTQACQNSRPVLDEHN